MIVYRIETVNNHGPYSGSRLQQATGSENHTMEKGRPTIIREFGEHYEYHPEWNKYQRLTEESYGGTKKQIREWFGEFKDWLKENNFWISKYSVAREYCVCASKQRVFDWTKAKLLETNIPLEDIL